MKAKAWKGAGQKCNLGVTFALPRVRKWTHTLPNVLWELESLWSSESSKKYFKGQNSVNKRFSYTIGKLLKGRCLKWACMTHFEYLKHMWWPKKGSGVKCQFDSRPLKVKNRPEINAWRWRAIYCWKDLDEGYNFSLDFTSIEGLKKIMAFQSVGSPNFGNSQLGSPKTKWHLDVAPMANHIEYYKGEGGGFL
jgi:hypothetical protein